MPKEPPRRSARSTAARSDPAAKPQQSKTAPKKTSKKDDTATEEHEPKKHYNKDDPKASHLYTDDNPATTLHGTGFKDEATAKHTLELISKRSITYQFQTVNTMFNRAKNHPHSKGNKDIEAAMKVFRTWLDDTYPKAKEDRKDFKPLLKKETVKAYLNQIKERKIDDTWAKVYADLPKGKRLANVLMDDEKPGEADMDIAREEKLTALTKGKAEKLEDDELWEDVKHEKPTQWHLECIAWAWSPVSERKL